MTTMQETFNFRQMVTDVEALLRAHASTTFKTTLVRNDAKQPSFLGEVVPIDDAAAIIARYIIGPTQK